MHRSTMFKMVSLAVLSFGCGGPPRFAQAGAFSATGTCGADLADTPRSQEDDAYGYEFYFNEIGVLIHIQDGRLRRVQYEAGDVFGEREFANTVLVAGRWQAAEIALRRDHTRVKHEGFRLRLPDGPQGSAHIELMVRGERMQMRLDRGNVVDAECAWD